MLGRDNDGHLIRKASQSTPVLYSNKKAKRSMSDNLSEEEYQAKMLEGLQKLETSKISDYSCGSGLTSGLVADNSCLQPFVCSLANYDTIGVSKGESGGEWNKALYAKVSCGKHVKFVGHKLALANKLDIRYDKVSVKTGSVITRETSHLCHSAQGCFNPDHLTGESHEYNVARNSGCGCAGWFFFKDTTRLVCYCTHEPRCMFVRVVQQEL